MAMWPFGKKKKDADKETPAEPSSAESLAAEAGESSTSEGPAQVSTGLVREDQEDVEGVAGVKAVAHFHLHL